MQQTDYVYIQTICWIHWTDLSGTSRTTRVAMSISRPANMCCYYKLNGFPPLSVPGAVAALQSMNAHHATFHRSFHYESDLNAMPLYLFCGCVQQPCPLLLLIAFVQNGFMCSTGNGNGNISSNLKSRTTAKRRISIAQAHTQCPHTCIIRVQSDTAVDHFVLVRRRWRHRRRCHRLPIRIGIIYVS